MVLITVLLEAIIVNIVVHGNLRVKNISDKQKYIPLKLAKVIDFFCENRRYIN